MVERFLNRLNVVRGIGGGVVCIVLAVGAFSHGGWFGWTAGPALLAVAVYAFVWPVLWPKYRAPAP
jgi:hypothetical protein